MPYNAEHVASTMNIFGVGANDAKKIIDDVNGVNQNRVYDPVQRSSGKEFQKALSSSLGELAPLAYQLYGISQANSAWSAEQARDLRNWQQSMLRYQMDFNASEAAKNRNWQERMSNTAHQREVQDLLAAGLNPVLSATGGNGAAVTSGATASASLPSGAMGSPDTSANSAIVGLLGSMLSAQTQLASTAMSAANNLAISEKNNATSKEIAQLQTSVNERIAMKQIDATLSNAQLSAWASMYGADSSKFASIVGSQLGYDASIYGYDRSYDATVYGVDTNAQLTQEYPNNPWRMLASAGKSVAENAGFTNFSDFFRNTYVDAGTKVVYNFLTNKLHMDPEKANRITGNVAFRAQNFGNQGSSGGSRPAYFSPTESFKYKFITGTNKLWDHTKFK